MRLNLSGKRDALGALLPCKSMHVAPRVNSSGVSVINNGSTFLPQQSTSRRNPTLKNKAKERTDVLG